MGAKTTTFDAKKSIGSLEYGDLKTLNSGQYWSMLGNEHDLPLVEFY